MDFDWDRGLTPDQFDLIMLERDAAVASTGTNSNSVYTAPGSYDDAAPDIQIILTTTQAGDGFSLNNTSGDAASNYYIARLNTKPDDLHINTSSQGTISLGASTASLLIDGATGKVTAAAALTADGALYVGGAATFAQTAQVVGALSAASVSVATTISAAKIILPNAASFTGIITDLDMPATFTIPSQVTVSNGLITSNLQATGSSPCVACPQNVGDFISANYSTTTGDRYGFGQYSNGVTRCFTSSPFGPARVCLSFATNAVTNASAAFRDVLVLSQNPDTITVNGVLTATGALSAASATLSGLLTAGSASVTGTLTSGAVSVSNAISAASASISGTLSAATANLSGALNAASASISGALSAASANISGALSAASANVSGLLTTVNANVTGTLTVDGNVITGSNPIPTEIGYPTVYVTADTSGSLVVPGQLTVNANNVNGNVTSLSLLDQVGASASTGYNQLVVGTAGSTAQGQFSEAYLRWTANDPNAGGTSASIGVAGGYGAVTIDANGSLYTPGLIVAPTLYIGGTSTGAVKGTGINLFACGKASFASIPSNGQSTYLTLNITHNLNLSNDQLTQTVINTTVNSYNQWHCVVNVTNSTANGFSCVVVHMYIGATANDVQVDSMGSSGYGNTVDWTLFVF